MALIYSAFFSPLPPDRVTTCRLAAHVPQSSSQRRRVSRLLAYQAGFRWPHHSQPATAASGSFRPRHWFLQLDTCLLFVALKNGDMASFLERKTPDQLATSLHSLCVDRGNCSRGQLELRHSHSWACPGQESPSIIPVRPRVRHTLDTTTISKTGRRSHWRVGYGTADNSM